MININELPTISLGVRTKDLTDKKQGKLTFIKPAKKENNRIYWWVSCECGNIQMIRSDSKNTACKECNNLIKKEKLKGIFMNDLTNQKFEKLTALYPLDERKNKKIIWHCQCDCGNTVDVESQSLTSGNTKSCGCLRKEKANFTKLKLNLIGKQFEYLTVLEETSERQYEKVVWKCQCECGNIVYLNTSRLTNGNDISCGCKKQSLGALKIQKILEENQINFIKEYIDETLKNRRFDFAIKKDNSIIRLIEFDGEQHYRSSGGWNTEENLKITQQRDKEKNEWALKNNIPLVRIPYWERDNITLEMIMGDQYLI